MSHNLPCWKLDFLETFQTCFRVQVILCNPIKGAIVRLGSVHLRNSGVQPLCTRIHSGFYLYCTCMLRLHLVDHWCMLALTLQYFLQTPSNLPKLFFVKSAARSIRWSFFGQLCSKVHSPKFFTAKIFFRTVYKLWCVNMCFQFYTVILKCY